MIDHLLTTHKNTIHLSLFVGGLILLLALEKFFPRRPFHFSRPIRIFSNISLASINNLVLQLTFPFLAVGLGVFTVEKGWGLMQHWEGPFWLELLVGILLLDLLIYWQHIVFHRIPWLWRLHRVHHADLDLDVTTGIRFHTLEILISMGLKFGFIILVGAPPLTIFCFELILMLSSMFNHANLNLPLGVDRLLRLLMITPDMHRVHHSLHMGETNSNFGFNFPWWDRLFKTYTPQPKDGHLKMLVGIDLFRSERWLTLHRLFIEPFVDRKD